MSRSEQLDSIECFLAVVDYGSFSAAAEQTHRSQSRVSIHLAALERSLGAPLFDRRYRPVRLTDAGRAYLPYARFALSQLALGADAVSVLNGRSHGVVVVGAHPSVSAAFIAPLLASFSANYPDVRVELVEDTAVILTQKLLSGHVDIAVCNSLPSTEAGSLVSRPLWMEPFVAVFGPEAELDAAPGLLDPAVLSNESLVTIGRPGGFVEQEIFDVVRDWGIEVEFRWQTQQPQTLMNLVRSGLGVGLINQLAFTISDRSELIGRPIGFPSNGREVAVWWDEKKHMSGATSGLLEAIQSQEPPADTIKIARSTNRSRGTRADRRTP